MARALSMSRVLPRVISYAVLRTMPSVGMRSVGAVVNFANAGWILMDGSRREKSITRLRVANVLVTSTSGAFSPGFHSATIIAAPYFGSVTLRTDALLFQLLP